jgi:hypothetical protein
VWTIRRLLWTDDRSDYLISMHHMAYITPNESIYMGPEMGSILERGETWENACWERDNVWRSCKDQKDETMRGANKDLSAGFAIETASVISAWVGSPSLFQQGMIFDLAERTFRGISGVHESRYVMASSKTCLWAVHFNVSRDFCIADTGTPSCGS